MKRLVLVVLIMVMCLAGAVTAGANTEPQTTDNANSWRYENGQLKSENGGIKGLLTYPGEFASHPDATLKGIDVSHHQGEIDWEKVKKSGVNFVILRCGYGLNKPEWDDRQFQRNADECERLGIPYGVYIYSYADDAEDAVSEAEHVLRLVKDRNLSYPIYFDMEDNSTLIGSTVEEQAANLALFAEAFCEKIEAAGYPVGIYANLNWFNTYLTDDCFDQWHRWVAQYNTECRYQGEYAMWQYTSSGAVDGINGRVDMNFQIGYPADHGEDVDAVFNGNSSVRVAGENRYDTALLAADQLKLSERKVRFNNIIVASGNDYPDALAGSYLAKVKEAPILLVGTDGDSEKKVADYIKKNLEKDGTVYLLGGTGVVRTDFENKLDDVNVTRLAGANRYETNIEILKAADVKNTDLLICTGYEFADSLSGAAVGLPILLVAEEITAAQQSWMDTVDAGKLYLLGGEGAVNNDIESYLKGKYITERLAGVNRFETSAVVAEKFFPEAYTLVLAYGFNFPDGLASGPLAMSLDAPLLLVDNNNYGNASEYADKTGVVRTAVLGGSVLISDEVVKNIIK